MTALAMIIGMIPMALGLGEGGEQNAPLGRAVIGGLLCATVATLVFVPAVFSLLHRGRRKTTPTRRLRRKDERSMLRPERSTLAIRCSDKTRRNCDGDNDHAGSKARSAADQLQLGPGSGLSSKRHSVLQRRRGRTCDRCDPWRHSRTHGSVEAWLQSTDFKAAIPSVNVVHPQADTRSQEIVLPGNTQAFTDSPIYARTNGYLRRWYFDIGARVKKGELLAEIETPEVDQQLQQAQAELETAQANLRAGARPPRTRGRFCSRRNSVSKQETDQAVDAITPPKSRQSIPTAANVARLEQLQSFEKVYAPFDGVITARSTDIGALIDAGAKAHGKELFHMAAIRELARLRCRFPKCIAPRSPAHRPTLTLDEYPGAVFHGKLVSNFTRSIPRRAPCWSKWMWITCRPAAAGRLRSVHLKLPADDSLRDRSRPTRCSSAGKACRSASFETARRTGAGHDRPRLWRQRRDCFRLAAIRRCDSRSVGFAGEWHGRRDQQFEDGRSWEMKRLTLILLLFTAMLIAGCTVGPKYARPNVPTAFRLRQFKETDDWKPAQPSDQLLRAKWWEIFGDPQLNALENELTLSNQDLKVAEARFRRGAGAGPLQSRRAISDYFHITGHRINA